VASSSSLADVMRKLGLRPTGGNHRQIAARIRLAQLDTSHFGWGKLRAQVRAAPRKRLVALVAESLSVAKVLAALGLPTEGRAHREMVRRLRELGIDTSHFHGQGWSRGFTRASHPSVELYSRKRSIPDDEVFVANGPVLNGRSLVRRLLAK